jgi:hypothetical protein
MLIGDQDAWQAAWSAVLKGENVPRPSEVAIAPQGRIAYLCGSLGFALA